VFNWLKKIFSGGSDEPSDMVTDVSIEDLSSDSIIRDLTLENTGTREGVAGRPPTSATTADQYEKEIFRKFDVNKQKNQRKISGALDKNSNSFITAKQTIDHPKKAYQQVPYEAKTKLDTGVYDRNEKTIKDKINILKSNLNVFKQKNDLVAEAHYSDSFIFHYAIIFILFFIETAINGSFFGAAVKGGLVEGGTIAASISIINIGLAILLGGFIFPETNHINKTKRTWGIVGMFIVIPILIFWNLYIAHFRTLFDEKEILERSFAQMNLEILPHMSQDLFDLSRDGFTLFGIGLLVCVLIFIKSYRVDDKYPGYGRATRRVKNAENEKERLYGEWERKVINVYNRAWKHTDNISKRMNTAVRHWRKYIEACEEIVTKHENLITNLEKNINLCLDTYRASNIAARKNSNSHNPPKYFGKQFEYDQKARDYHNIYKAALNDIPFIFKSELKEKKNKEYIDGYINAHKDTNKILETDRDRMINHFGKPEDIMKKPPTIPSAPVVQLIKKEDEGIDKQSD